MANSYSTIAFHAQHCDGCGDCMSACAQAKSGTDDLIHSRLQIIGGTAGIPAEIAICRQCGDPKCVMNCPAAALSKNDANGVIDWDGSLCVNCLLCTVGCVYAGISHNAALGHVAKCDLCDGDPACVKACPHGALEFNRTAEIYNQYGAEEDLFVAGLSACQGCNSELMIRHSLRRIGDNVVVAAPPGCIPGMGTVGYNGRTGAKVPIFHPLLTNTASMLAGIKRQYNRVGRDVTMVALAGDGGAGDVGFQSLSGAAERGEQILFIVVDNEGYMNTGMQSSGCTSFGSWTSTTPVGSSAKGKHTDSKNLPLIMMMHNCAYVATASLAFMDDYYDKLNKALAATQHGFAYLHIYSPCPTGWRIPAEKTIEACRKGVETNFAPLWEFTPGAGLQFTHPTDKPLPLSSYISLMGKYRHLEAYQTEHLQQVVDERLRVLQGFQRASNDASHKAN